MADISLKESPYYNKSLVITSTPYKSIDDSGYNTPSYNVSSNLSQISEVSISFDHTPSDIDSLQLSSPTLDKNHRKLEDITNTVESPTKKFKLCSDAQFSVRLNDSSNNDDSQFLKRKNYILPKNVNYERNSIEGREKVDIMYFLSERYHFQPVIEKILSFLSGSDILSMSMVSKIWSTAVENSPIAQKKKQKYFKLSKENRCGHVGRDRSAFNNKGCLANISNVMCSPSKKELPQRSPPVSPSKYRFHVFQKEAKKLSSDQQLVPCPRCSRPASWSPSQSTRAECKGFHCKFIFCTECKCEYSNTFDHKCLSIPILSMSSYNCRPMVYNLSRRKRNLRRL
ncbi:PREDICTED: F-box only protein 5-like [Diuraphis noxia]|uniref:F-box only protein 5-like n=1 Tax=Diuraphis noxia TaxID=143948 RepID=UPI000763564E|nr:PREDICTED: F-box only protein 5-like [Diuraphis noxia]XP_015367214.1 PREDICTED: F-box only protein 5-like [Diuraphis noxia]